MKRIDFDITLAVHQPPAAGRPDGSEYMSRVLPSGWLDCELKHGAHRLRIIFFYLALPTLSNECF